MITAATTAKTATQMTVVNQNVNSIRSISSEAEVGSHGTSTATTDASDSREDAVDRDPDDGAPAHRGEPTATRTRNDASNVCYMAPKIGANANTPHRLPRRTKWVLE